MILKFIKILRQNTRQGSIEYGSLGRLCSFTHYLQKTPSYFVHLKNGVNRQIETILL